MVIEINYNKNILGKGWGFFDIMHKDRKVARIYEDGHTTIYFPTFMSHGLYFEQGNEIDIKINNLINFYHWCSSRTLTLDRKYLKEILNNLNASQSFTDKDRAIISISYHSLSLLDVFWVKYKNEKIHFDDISLYRHSLSGTLIDVYLKGKSLNLDNINFVYDSYEEAANFSTPGVSPKAWIKKDNFYLLKDGDERDVYAEILASKIIKCFNVDSVEYTSDIFDDKIVSKCQIITRKDIGIIPFEYVDVYCANHGINTMEFVLKKDSYNYYMMNIIDYLIGNSDRHWQNWGFYIDNKTNKLLRLYPLMDFNKAFTSYDTIDGSISRTM